MTAAIKPPTVEPVFSGAYAAPDCGDLDCTGYRTWDFPAGPVDGHCGCPVGRLKAEHDYAARHRSRLPIGADSPHDREVTR